MGIVPLWDLLGFPLLTPLGKSLLPKESHSGKFGAYEEAKSQEDGHRSDPYTGDF